MTISRGNSDPLVVALDQFVALIQPLTSARDQLHEEDGRLEAGKVWLARQVGSHPDYVHRIMSGKEGKWLTLRLVDKWLTALNLTSALHDGTLRIVANPRWTQEDWVASFHACGERPPDDVEVLW